MQRLACADEVLPGCQPLNVIDQLMIPFIEIVRAESRFIAIMHELILKRRLRVHQLDGGMTIVCVDQDSFRLRPFRKLAVRAWGLNTHEVPGSNDGRLRRPLAVSQRRQDARKSKHHGF